jgi:tetratricopeptide (TPR) repeat protein
MRESAELTVRGRWKLVCATAFTVILVVLIIFGALPQPARGQNASQIQGQNTSRQIYHVSDPEAGQLHDLLASAQSRLEKKDYPAAVTLFQNYIARQPNDAVAHFQLGYAFTALKKPDDAAREYAKAAELDPKMAEAQLNWGLTLLDTNPSAAINPLRRAEALMPDQARPKFLLGWALERSGQRADAISEYRAAEKLDANNFDIHLGLARTLLAAGQTPDAETEFRAALVLRPGTPVVELGLAQCLIARKQLPDAATQLRAYLEAQPKDADTRVQLASLLRDMGQLEDALRELQHVPDNGVAAVVAEKLQAEIYEQQKNPTQAASALAQVIKAAPQDADAHAELGRLELRARNYPAAAKELAAALELDPKDDSLLSDLVAAHYLGGDFPGALNILSTLEQRRPLTADEWYLRALSNDKTGHAPEAYAAFEKFLELNKGAENDQYFFASARARVLESELKNKKK